MHQTILCQARVTLDRGSVDEAVESCKEEPGRLFTFWDPCGVLVSDLRLRNLSLSVS